MDTITVGVTLLAASFQPLCSFSPLVYLGVVEREQGRKTPMRFNERYPRRTVLRSSIRHTFETPESVIPPDRVDMRECRGPPRPRMRRTASRHSPPVSESKQERPPLSKLRGAGASVRVGSVASLLGWGQPKPAPRAVSVVTSCPAWS